jgi:hypothetical protein
VLISQTKSRTYNLLNATIYYHLLSPVYRLQPFISVGINDVINDASYASAPIGLGAKFNARKIMAMAEISYGYGLSKNISNTTMYSVGFYLPIKNKKQKKEEAMDNSPYNRPGKDTATKGSVVNNFYITIKMDSALNARKGADGRDGRDGRDADNNGRSAKDGPSDGAVSSSGADNNSSFDPQDFKSNDFQMDTVDGLPVIRCVVYFEFNQYSLTSSAFPRMDKIIKHLRSDTSLQIDVK